MKMIQNQYESGAWWCSKATDRGVGGIKVPTEKLQFRKSPLKTMHIVSFWSRRYRPPKISFSQDQADNAVTLNRNESREAGPEPVERLVLVTQKCTITWHRDCEKCLDNRTVAVVRRLPYSPISKLRFGLKGKHVRCIKKRKFELRLTRKLSSIPTDASLETIKKLYGSANKSINLKKNNTF
jgi:hypothetical protein